MKERSNQPRSNRFLVPCLLILVSLLLAAIVVQRILEPPRIPPAFVRDCDYEVVTKRVAKIEDELTFFRGMTSRLGRGLLEIHFPGCIFGQTERPFIFRAARCRKLYKRYKGSTSIYVEIYDTSMQWDWRVKEVLF